MVDYVLVHGAWHGGWCWRRVADRLSARGARVFAPTLTGLADRSHLLTPSVGLDTHIDDIVNLVRWEDLQDVVLCGHSYAGMVITGVAEQISGRIAAIVYLDAFVPHDGQSLSDVLGMDAPPDIDVFAPPPAAAFHLDGADAAWVDGKVTPQPAATLRQKLRVTEAYQGVASKTYVLAAKHEPHPALVAAYERFSCDPSWSAVKLAAGHELMIEDPEGIARLLLGLAGGEGWSSQAAGLSKPS